MKKYWPTILIFILFISLLGYVIFTWGNKNSKQENTKKIFEIPQDQISSIEVVSTSKFEIKKINNYYSLLMPEEIPAYESYGKDLFAQASKIEYTDIISQNEADLSPYGLNDPLVAATIKLKDGSQKVIQIGNDTPIGESVYLKEGGQNTVYKVSLSSIDQFQESIDNIINKNVLNGFKPDDSNKVILIIDGQAKTFDKKDGKWFTDGKELSNDKVGQLKETLSSIEVDGLADKNVYVDASAKPFIKLQAYKDSVEIFNLSMVEKDIDAYHIILKGLSTQYYINKETFEPIKEQLIKTYDEAFIK